MTSLGQVASAIEAHHDFVAREVGRARTDAAFAGELRTRWSSARNAIESTPTPSGLTLPRLALPATDEPGAIAEFLLGQGLPGEFPFANAAYREMYLDQPGVG